MTISRAFAHTILAYAESGLTARESVDRVTTFMKKRGLAHFLPAVVRELERMERMRTDTETLKIYSPFPLGADLVASITKATGGDDRVVTEIIDPSLIGGFRTEASYQYFDATIAHALTRLKHHLLQN